MTMATFFAVFPSKLLAAVAVGVQFLLMLMNSVVKPNLTDQKCEVFTMKKILVIYFSRKGENHMPGGVKFLEKGHTARAAEYIRDAVDADLFEIETVKPYADGYKACCMEAVAEASTNARPEIRSFGPDISEYETIFVCYPIWCGTAPMCVFTYLEHFNWTGKRVVPLCTHEGSGLANSVKDLERSCKGAEIAPGLMIRGNRAADSQAEIAAWAKENV